MDPIIKSYLSKLNFSLGRNPRIEKTDDFRKYIPEPYQAVITISADFELAWAWRYSRSLEDPLGSALEKARRARRNMPKILDLCEEFNIPITWATVGHLMLESCTRPNGKAHPELPRLPYFENNYWKFSEGDWFRHDPAADYLTAPEWYAPDLVKLIRDSAVDHEIACHTFSHIDCRDQVCQPEVFEAELNACQQAAADYDTSLKTFIYPAHTVGNLESLRPAGFTNYRSNQGNTLGYPVQRDDGLWEIKSTMEMKFRDDWSADYHRNRTRKVIDRAIASQTTCHFWFHPSFTENYLEQVMPAVFEYLNSRRDQILVTTMKDYTDWLNSESTSELFKLNHNGIKRSNQKV